MLDMFQITEAFDKYKGSMERVGKALDEYSDNTLLDKVYFLELAVFCFLTGNNDMQLKNFSMIFQNNKWTLAPAYDLLNVAIVNPEDTEELALTLEGKKRKLHWEHFQRLGLLLGLNTKIVHFFLMNTKRSIKIVWKNDIRELKGECVYDEDFFQKRYKYVTDQNFVVQKNRNRQKTSRTTVFLP